MICIEVSEMLCAQDFRYLTTILQHLRSVNVRLLVAVNFRDLLILPHHRAPHVLTPPVACDLAI